MHSTAPQHTSKQEAITEAIASASEQPTESHGAGIKHMQQSHGSLRALSHDKPMGCQLSRGCPGEIKSYSADEEPGWFPEMEKVTAKVL